MLEFTTLVKTFENWIFYEHVTVVEYLFFEWKKIVRII